MFYIPADEGGLEVRRRWLLVGNVCRRSATRCKRRFGDIYKLFAVLARKERGRLCGGAGRVVRPRSGRGGVDCKGQNMT